MKDEIPPKMKDEFFVCECGSDEHTLRFTYDEDETENDLKEIYTSVYLNQHRSFFKRLWVAIRYVFGYKCKYGHWDCFVLRREDAERMIRMLKEYLS